MTAPAPDDVFEALVAAFPSRNPAGPLSVRRAGDEAVLMFRWPPHPHLFGVPVSLTSTHRRLDWDEPAADLDDALAEPGLWGHDRDAAGPPTGRDNGRSPAPGAGDLPLST